MSDFYTVNKEALEADRGWVRTQVFEGNYRDQAALDQRAPTRSPAYSRPASTKLLASGATIVLADRWCASRWRVVARATMPGDRSTPQRVLQLVWI
jgi:hypothetical protein